MKVRLVDPTDLDLIHELYKAEMADTPCVALAKVIVDKLYKQRILLSQSEISELLDLIREDPIHPCLPAGRNGRLLNCHVELDRNDIQRVEQEVNNIEKSAPKIFDKRAKEMAKRVLKDLKKTWPKYSQREERETTGFNTQLRRRWKKPLSTVRHFLTIATQLLAGFRTQIDSDQTKPMLWEVLTRLHARAISTSEEIYCLLASGFADGALSRWRTLHELAVISHFIRLHGEEAAKKYFDHQCFAAKKRMDQLATPFWVPAASPDAKFAADRAELNDVCASFLHKYGSSFGTDYGWASDALQKSGVAFGKSGPSFRQIEDAVGAGHYRAHYQWASANIHAGSRGTYTTTSIDFPSVHIGPTNFGLDVPGTSMIYVMAEMTEDLISLYPSLDAVIHLMMLNTLAAEAEKNFEKCKRQLAAKEAVRTKTTV